MIRNLGRSIGRSVLNGVGRAVSRLQEQKSLPADLLESDDAYLAVFDAAGAEASDVTVRYHGNVLSVHIDRFRDFHDGYEMRFPGRGLTLEGDIEFPEGASVDADRAEATVTQSGTLEVFIPKVSDENQGADADSVKTSTLEEGSANEDSDAPEAN